MLKNLFSKGAPAAEPDAQESGPAESRSFTAGWLLNTETTSIIWDTPRAVRVESQSSDPRSVGMCPSVLDFDRRHFVINCPIDVHLRMNLSRGDMEITNVLAEKSPIRSEELQRWIVFQPRHEWRNPQRPVLQMLTSYVFVSDDPLFINQMPPLLHYAGDTRPGVQINGRFPIDIWPRALMGEADMFNLLDGYGYKDHDNPYRDNYYLASRIPLVHNKVYRDIYSRDAPQDPPLPGEVAPKATEGEGG